MKKLISLILWLILFASFWISNAQEDFDDFLKDLFDTVDSSIEDEVYDDFDVSNDDELDLAVDWMYDNNLTKFRNTDDYEPNWKLLREQAAKFFGVYATEFLWLEESNKYDCDFSDQENGHEGLWPNVIEACRLWLFKGADGAYLPKRTLTNAQAMTVLIKALEWVPEILVDGHRAMPFYLRARNLWLLNELPAFNSDHLDDHITRWDVAILMYRSRNVK